MKYYEYNMESNKIEFFNSFFGKETILVNGKKTSEKYSITGTYHFFKINSINILLKTDYKLFKDRKIELNLFQNRQLVDYKNIEINKRYKLIVFAVGIFIGFWLIKFYN
ncbi:hypothetical protein N8258_02665 [Algibacter sp.]|nr:hypothetical protein [Algibacter sp.]MDC1365303.1 hypothetical protein [Algibacter sp.]